MDKPNKTSGSSFAANVVYSLLSMVLPMLFAVIATGYLVRHLGTESYGYYSLVLAIVGFGFTTGIGKVAAKYVPEYLASGRTVELADLLKATVVITAVIAIAEAVLLALFSPMLVSNILNVPASATPDLRFAVFVACLIGPAMMLSQVFQSAVQGVHRFFAFSILTIAASLVLNLGSVLLAIAKVPYKEILLLNLAVFALGAVAFFLVARRAIPELTSGKLVRETANRVGRFAASIFVYQSITSIFYLFERSYILRKFGADALTYYTVPFMFGLYLHGLILSFAQAAIPRLNEKIDSPEESRNIYESFTKMAAALALFISLMFYFLGHTFLSLWLGPEFSANAFQLMVLHGAAFATIAASIGCWILAEASHRPGMNAFSSVATVTVGIISMIVLAQDYGIEGIAAGRIVGAVVVLPLILILERKVFGRILARFWLIVIGCLGLSTVVVLAVNYFAFDNVTHSWPMFVFAGTVLTGAFWTPLFLSGYLDLRDLRSSFANRWESTEI